MAREVRRDDYIGSYQIPTSALSQAFTVNVGKALSFHLFYSAKSRAFARLCSLQSLPDLILVPHEGPNAMYTFYLFIVFLPTIILSVLEHDQVEVKTTQAVLRLVGIQQRKIHEKHMKDFFRESHRLPFQFPSSEQEAIEGVLDTLPRWHPSYDLTRHFKAIAEQRTSSRKRADNALEVHNLISKSVKGAIKAMPPVPPPNQLPWAWILEHVKTADDSSSSKSSSQASTRTDSSTKNSPRYLNYKGVTTDQALQRQGSPPKKGPSGLSRRTLKKSTHSNGYGTASENDVSEPAQGTRSKTKRRRLSSIAQGLHKAIDGSTTLHLLCRQDARAYYRHFLKMIASHNTTLTTKFEERENELLIRLRETQKRSNSHRDLHAFLCTRRTPPIHPIEHRYFSMVYDPSLDQCQKDSAQSNPSWSHHSLQSSGILEHRSLKRNKELSGHKAAGKKSLSTSPAQNTRSRTRKHVKLVGAGLRAVAANEGKAYVHHRKQAIEHYNNWMGAAVSIDPDVRLNYGAQKERLQKAEKNSEAAITHKDIHRLIFMGIPGVAELPDLPLKNEAESASSDRDKSGQSRPSTPTKGAPRRRGLEGDKTVGSKSFSGPTQNTRSKTRLKFQEIVRQGLCAVADNEGKGFIHHQHNAQEQFDCWLNMVTSNDRSVRCNWDERVKKINSGFESLIAAGKHMELQNLISKAVPGLKAIRLIDWRARQNAIQSVITKGIEEEGAKTPTRKMQPKKESSE